MHTIVHLGENQSPVLMFPLHSFLKCHHPIPLLELMSSFFPSKPNLRYSQNHSDESNCDPFIQFTPQPEPGQGRPGLEGTHISVLSREEVLARARCLHQASFCLPCLLFPFPSKSCYIPCEASPEPSHPAQNSLLPLKTVIAF